jgi:phosphatidylserine decarboxylase
MYYLAGSISERLWGRVPRPLQQRASAVLGRFFNTKISRFLIGPYCLFHYGDARYYRHFRPGCGGDTYRTFQSFFTRDFISPPAITAETVWPCEGFLCDKGQVRNLSIVKVKGEKKHLRAIFGTKADAIPDHGYFTNVFLHNCNYHHIHAPVNGVVRWVKNIPGELLLLRPWAYRDKPSLPAMTNERVNLCIEDARGREWFLSIVGGPVVASIRLANSLRIGNFVSVGEKIATFELGSTCCMVCPLMPCAEPGEKVSVGDALNRTAEQVSEPIARRQLCHAT